MHGNEQEPLLIATTESNEDPEQPNPAQPKIKHNLKKNRKSNHKKRDQHEQKQENTNVHLYSKKLQVVQLGMMGKLETAANKNEKITRNQGEEATNTILKHLG